MPADTVSPTPAERRVRWTEALNVYGNQCQQSGTWCISWPNFKPADDARNVVDGFVVELLASLAEARRERDALDIELAMRNSDFYDAQAELRELRETALTAEEAEELMSVYSKDWATVEVLPETSPEVNAIITAYAKLSRISAGTPEKENG